MVPFAAFWEGSSPEKRRNLVAFLRQGGWMEGQGGETERALRACLKYLAASSARILLVNLEDLWLEKNPQNVPGLQGYPNWRRKAQYALEDVMGMEAVTSVLRELHRIREGGGR
jgi:4-alpha-glucanotransferase